MDLRMQPIQRKDQRKWDQLADAASLARMRSLIDPQERETVCDVGTGKGNAALCISPFVDRVLAIDVVTPEVGVFKGKNIDFLLFDMDKGILPMDDLSQDIVICRAALHHFEQKQKFFQEAYRVLRPGGRLYIMDPIMSEQLRMAWSIISRIAESDYRDYCTEKELLGGVIECGFDIRYKGEFLFPRVLQDWINTKINLIDSAGKEVINPFVNHVRKTIWDVVFNLFDEPLQKELHLDKQSTDGWFAYNCIEIVAHKSAQCYNAD